MRWVSIGDLVALGERLRAYYPEETMSDEPTRTEADIRAEIARVKEETEEGVRALEADRDGVMAEAKALSKKIATEKRALASALRKLHTELGEILA